jgi:deazaflavin-dependent oxidoreductase (nitroreductase family)
MPSHGSAPDGHARFAVLNQTGNRVLRGLLRSPLHRLASGRVALITVTGRRSGREYTFPVAYSQDGDGVTIQVGWPESKVWWRNLRDGAEVRLRLRGEEQTGHARVEGDARTGVTVRVDLHPPPSLG